MRYLKTLWISRLRGLLFHCASLCVTLCRCCLWCAVFGAVRLQAEASGANFAGFFAATAFFCCSRLNLNNMRKFYLLYPICQTSDKLSWSHICELITADDPQEREFYFLTGITSNWPGINRNFLKFKQQLPSRWYAGASPAILTAITRNWPGTNRNFLKFKQQLPSRWYAGASPAIFNSNYQQLVSNYQQFARFASVIIYKIYRFREAERRAGEK